METTHQRRLERVLGHLQPNNTYSSSSLEIQTSSAIVAQEFVQEKYAGGPLEKYRKKANFDWLEMKKLLEGPYYELKKRIFNTLIGDPLFRQPVADLGVDKQQFRELTMLQMRRVVEYGFVTEKETQEDPYRGQILADCLNAFDASLSPKMGLHLGMFISCLLNMGTERHLPFAEKGK
jgi:acyl-CoA oxidase